MMRDQTLSGILYMEDFDTPDPLDRFAPMPVAEPEPEPPPPPIRLEPTFSLADLKRATDKAEEEALDRAAREAAASRQARETETLCRLADEMTRLREEVARVAHQAAADTAGAVLAMLSAALPETCAAHGTAEAAALLRLLLPTFRTEGRLLVRVHPDLVQPLRERVAEAVEGSADIDWRAVPAMLPGDLSAEWQNGTVTRDTASLCRRINELVIPFAHSARPEEGRDEQ